VNRYADPSLSLAEARKIEALELPTLIVYIVSGRYFRARIDGGRSQRVIHAVS
jgi:hypothetical protein